MDAGQRRKKWDLRPRSLFGQIMITMVCFVLAFFALICVYFLYQNSRALEKHRVNSGTELLEQSVGTVDRMLDDLSLLPQHADEPGCDSPGHLARPAGF